MNEAGKQWVKQYQWHLKEHLGWHPITDDDEAGEDVWRSAGGDITPKQAADSFAADFIAQANKHRVQIREVNEWKTVDARWDSGVGWCCYVTDDAFAWDFESAGADALALRYDSTGLDVRVIDQAGEAVPIPYSVRTTWGARMDPSFQPCKSEADGHAKLDQALSKMLPPGSTVLLWDEEANRHMKGYKIDDDGKLIDMPF